MSRRPICAGDRTIRIDSRKQRLIAVKAIAMLLECIRDAERRNLSFSPCPAAAPGRQYDAELIASTIDEAICILETLQ